MGNSKLPIVETFVSIQGEGPLTGRRALFIRLAGCNLRCAYCDTGYALSPDNSKKMTYQELYNVILSDYYAHTSHIVITGGEPLLYADTIALLIVKLMEYASIIEIETNGTIMPGDIYKIPNVHFNVSPKLSNSGVKRADRYKKDVLSFYSNIENSIFKFVVSNKKDVEEVKSMVNEFYIPNNRVFLMPLASTKKSIGENASKVAELAIKNQFNYSDRLQIRLWGNKRGR